MAYKRRDKLYVGIIYICTTKKRGLGLKND